MEDFLHPSGKICLIKEETPANQKSESGVFSSIYSYFTVSEAVTTKGPTPEEQEATKVATKCIHDCHLEQLINDSKFLREESLHELVKVTNWKVFGSYLITEYSHYFLFVMKYLIEF